MSVRRMTEGEFYAALKGQGVPAREHCAVVCPICGTVQSIESLRKAGVPEARLEGQVGFSCIGRWTGAGSFQGKKASASAAQKGCDWTLGGLFQLHKVEVLMEDGTIHPVFQPATPEQAMALMASLQEVANG